jgi:hypothetical protein
MTVEPRRGCGYRGPMNKHSHAYWIREATSPNDGTTSAPNLAMSGNDRRVAGDYSYLAGLIDGDGSILIVWRGKNRTAGDRRRRTGFQVTVKIGGAPDHLRRLSSEFQVGGLWIRKRDGYRHLAEWTITGSQARQVLICVLPHVRHKQPQAVLALSMSQPRTRWGATAELRAQQIRCWTEMRLLNTAGRRKGEVRLHGG